MGEDPASTSAVCRLVALLVLGAACQASLDLDQYAFDSGGTVGEFEAPPPGGTSAVEVVGMGGTTPGAPVNSLAPSGSGGASGAGAASEGAAAGTGGSNVVVTVGNGGSTSLKVCPDEELLIDDMEDEPAWICPHFGRTANEWYSFVGSSDEIVTATLSPPELVYADIPGGRMGSERAIHLVMSTLDANDFAGFGANFSFETVNRAFDASVYGGLSFYARGSGTVLVRLTTAETIPIAEGGRCEGSIEEPCYNDHNVVLPLTEAWQLYQYSFDSFMPANYGPPRNFNPAELFGLIISPQFGQSDIDVWIDDVWFLPGSITE